MAMNVQGSTPGLGMAPQGAGAGSALPPLTPGDQGAAATDPAAAAGTDPAAAGAAGGGGFDINKLASSGRWLGPLLTIGGGVAALTAFAKGQDGSKFLKFGGLTAAVSGVGLTAIGFKAKGIETGTQATTVEAVAALETMKAESQQQLQLVTDSANSRIAQLQQQAAAAQQAQMMAQQQPGVQTPGGAGTGGPMDVGPGLDTTSVPGAGQQAPVGQGGEAQGSGGSTPVGGAGQTTGTQAASWAGVQSLMGQTVELAAGASASGNPIADAGTYRIEATPGDPNGYASIDEANAAARQSMSTELMGSKFLRWMVVEHEGRFYAAVAKQLPEGAQPAPLSPQLGQVVAWSAMNHVTDNGVTGWQAYSWSQGGGAQSMAVPYGTTNVFGGVSGGGPVGGAPVSGGGGATLPGTNIPVPGGSVSVMGGGARGAAFDPASQVGLTFSINASNTAEGDLARGGVLQVQRFVESSAGGFGTAEEAAVAARAARKAAGGGDQWSRWITVQGADNRYYVYEGSIVKRATQELQAAPVHVFGVGFSEHFDGATNAWKAVRDAA